MRDLRQQLSQCLAGRVLLVGLGSAQWGDDALGIRLAERVAQQTDLTMRRDREGQDSSRVTSVRPRVSVLIAGTVPERFLSRVIDGEFDQVVFLDAVEFGGEPGAVIFLGAEQIAAQFPQVSTHKLSLGLLARYVETEGRARAWLLGVQPESLKESAHLRPAVQTTLELLERMLIETLRKTSWPPDPRAFRWSFNPVLSRPCQDAGGRV